MPFHVAEIAARELGRDERETYSNGVRNVLHRDPDGNELELSGAPLNSARRPIDEYLKEDMTR
jgi:hypothetical protein